MFDKSKTKLLLERWSLSIKKEDRKHDNMPNVFDNLANQLFTAGIEFEVAYETMKVAAKYMYPVPEAIKYVYARNPMKKFQSLQEFTKSWQESLDKSALIAFYEYYDIEGLDPTKIPAKKQLKISSKENTGMVTEDELNEEDFWKSTKTVSKTNPWLFVDEDQIDE